MAMPKNQNQKIRKSFFFTIAGSGDEQNLNKNIYIFALYITQAFFCPLSWNFSTTRSGAVFLGHPSVHTINTPKIKKKKIFAEFAHFFKNIKFKWIFRLFVELIFFVGV